MVDMVVLLNYWRNHTTILTIQQYNNEIIFNWFYGLR